MLWFKILHISKNIVFVFSKTINTMLLWISGNEVKLRDRKIRLIEGTAKCRHLNKLTWRGTLQQVFICGPELHSPPYTLYTCIQYTYHTGKGGGRVEPERRLEGQQFTKLGRKYQHNWLHLQPKNSDKHLPRSPFTGQFFRWRHLLWCLYN